MTTALGPRCLFCPAGTAEGPAFAGAARRCLGCGMMWSPGAAIPTADLYSGEYFAGGGYEDYFLVGPRSFEARRRVEWMLGHVRPRSLLEVGCAAGFFVAEAARAGIDARGLELSHQAAEYARAELGIPVVQGAFEDSVPDTGAGVGALCAFHVLEHVADPRRFLAAAKAHLQPGGFLVLEVPNAECGAARIQGAGWPGLQPDYHRWHFGPRSLSRLLAANGFTVQVRDTVAFRYYMPAQYRRRHVRRLFPADLLALCSPRLTHPSRGDLLRIIARATITEDPA